MDQGQTISKLSISGGQYAPVYWITGLSGSGKSTLGNALYLKLKQQNPATVFLDGDNLRQVYGDSASYDSESRKSIAKQNARLAHLLSSQGIQVVIATISLFHEVQDWNRKNLPGYVEIFLDTPITIIKARCAKGLYSENSTNMVGQDVFAEYPLNPHFVFDTTNLAPENIVETIIKETPFGQD
ncbi:MAG: adenylyl-sulfate kinase [Pseudomonadales bacterium]|uniref:Adenylyl-sulfate kinase n=1 Tax=Oleiphilus messinensis TaxID=141451 RepID=A0A1Y0ICQ3_9GAMM|nr:adenylyl-sulfate kinase [Oleiphilus messinensis]ARU57164.1 adenylyl-sulfate kinase [Oleiphilus messinensis]MCG8610965.1 adenylyl-sulfate kinase [Pseudomonadales bacterium]